MAIDRKFTRHLSNARRELRTAVDRFAEITDPLPGHKAEALRRAQDVRDAADELVKQLEERDE